MADHSIRGKVALIAGGAKNLGGLVARDLARQGASAIFFSRWLVSPLGPYVNLIAGSTAYGWARFTTAGIAGETVWAGLYVGTGYGFAGNVEDLEVGLRVSLRLLAFAEDAEIVRLIQSMDWSHVEVLRQAAVLAQHLWLVDRHELALEFLAHAAARVRPDPLLCHTRANVLRSLGRLDEATGTLAWANANKAAQFDLIDRHHCPSACCTMACCGARSSKPLMALRARSTDRASINSAMA